MTLHKARQNKTGLAVFLNCDRLPLTSFGMVRILRNSLLKKVSVPTEVGVGRGSFKQCVSSLSDWFLIN